MKNLKTLCRTQTRLSWTKIANVCGIFPSFARTSALNTFSLRVQFFGCRRLFYTQMEHGYLVYGSLVSGCLLCVSGFLFPSCLSYSGCLCVYGFLGSYGFLFSNGALPPLLTSTTAIQRCPSTWSRLVFPRWWGGTARHMWLRPSSW